MPTIIEIFSEKGIGCINLCKQRAAQYIYEKFVMDKSVSRSVVFETRTGYRDYLLTKLKDKDGLTKPCLLLSKNILVRSVHI